MSQTSTEPKLTPLCPQLTTFVQQWMESRPSVKAGKKEGSPVRFGILSTALINPAGLIHPVETHPGAVITAIASRDIKNAESAAKSYNIEKAYGCYEDLLADENIDAVYIPLPNGMHAGRSSIARPIARRLRSPDTL